MYVNIVKMRINGTKNISKITKSMKMVSAAKFRGDQQRLAAGIPFAVNIFFLIELLFLKLLSKAWSSKITGEKKNLEDIDVTNFPKKNLIVVLTTDKGLCGGVNTILGRMTRQMVSKLEAGGKEYKLFIQGEKGSGSFRRVYGDKFFATATERLVPYNFEIASAIAQDILAADYEAVHILYNEFKSAIVYIPSIKSIKPLLDINDPFLYPFELSEEDDIEALQNFYEYTLSTDIFYSMLQNAASEQSSRMNAMENASKNAGEMVGKLTLQYNRARQARITTELIEIISGASALKG